MADLEEITPVSPRPVRRALLAQRWTDLSFLHWRVEPERVARLLPAGTRPDVVDGASWVGLIGFGMVGLGFGRGPGLPWIGTFLETNVRLYSVDERGRRAVVFCSLDATRLVPVLTARLTLGLPYMWSRMGLDRSGDELAYTCRRRWPGPRGASSRMRVRVGPALGSVGPLEHFLTARWGLHTRVGRRTVHLPNEHPTWPLHRAELCDLDDDLLGAAGFADLTGPPESVLYSPGVAVRFGTPDVVATRQRGS